MRGVVAYGGTYSKRSYLYEISSPSLDDDDHHADEKTRWEVSLKQEQQCNAPVFNQFCSTLC